MVDKQIVEEWLQAAQKDLKIATEDIDKRERFEDVGFHCQQAAEKFLKAYIVAYELPFTKTHDLAVLLETCVKKDADVEKLRTQSRLLTPFYLGARYPDFANGEFKMEKVKEALGFAEEIAKFVKQKLSHS